MKEAAELRDPTEHYHAQPLEVRPCQCLVLLLEFNVIILFLMTQMFILVKRDQYELVFIMLSDVIVLCSSG